MRFATVAASAAILVGMSGRELRAQGAAPSGLEVWAADVCTDGPAKAPGGDKAVLIVAARNGTFSGKAVVSSGGAIKGLQASVSQLTGPAGAIPPANVRLRYATLWENRGWGLASGPDILQEVPPAEVQPSERGRRATAPIWITVQVPKDTKPGTYSGELAVRAQGLSPTKLPVKLEVVNWTLPDPQDYRTWLDFVQSPDTLAIEYKAPLWSDPHWELIARSFRLLQDTGARALYVPLICRTNFGNEQSMVRWIPKGGGRYEYDFSVLDRYLDTAEKNMGKPKLVIFFVWDICMSPKSLTRGLWGGENDTRRQREELLNKGPRVTAYNPATKEANVVTLPRYEDPASKALWGPMFAEVRKRMQARGLDKVMMLGLMPDLWPSKEEVAFWNEIGGNLPWAIHGHAGAPGDAAPGNKLLYKIADIGYAAYVYNLVFNVNPEKGRLYGWREKGLITNYLRGGDLMMASAVEVRVFPAFNITGGQRGAGRLGADLWPVLKDKKGARAGQVWARYPENNWRNLDLSNWFLAPGPDGALGTVRLEALKEGMQECEARIFLEDALLDPGKKARLGAELAQKSQDALDEHHRAMWKTVWTDEEDLKTLGKIAAGRNPPEGLWEALVKSGKKLPGFWDGPARQRRSDEARKGEAWFVEGWQERERKLFTLAGEAAAKLGVK